jgi:nicotinamidase-related amidase
LSCHAYPKTGLFDDPAYYGGQRSTPGFEQTISAVLSLFRSLLVAAASLVYSVVHVKHISSNEGSPLNPAVSLTGGEHAACARPHAGEPVFSKHTSSAFVGTDLEEHLRAAQVDRLVIAGLVTNHCVSSTT